MSKDTEKTTDYVRNHRDDGWCQVDPTLPNSEDLLSYGVSHSIVRLFEGTVSHQLETQRLNMVTSAECVNAILNGGRNYRLTEDLLVERSIDRR